MSAYGTGSYGTAVYGSGAAPLASIGRIEPTSGVVVYENTGSATGNIEPVTTVTGGI